VLVAPVGLSLRKISNVKCQTTDNVFSNLERKCLGNCTRPRQQLTRNLASNLGHATISLKLVGGSWRTTPGVLEPAYNERKI
jgi:hypothetical protein